MVRIVEYSDEYKDQVIQLILDVYENELGFVGYERPDISAIPATYQRDSASNFWIALDGKNVVGTVAVLGKTQELVYLKRMVLKKDYRNQGIGAQLLEQAINFSKAHGYTTMYAGTVEENRNAIQFYEHQGFVRTDDVPEDITAADHSVCLKLDLL